MCGRSTRIYSLGGPGWNKKGLVITARQKSPVHGRLFNIYDGFPRFVILTTAANSAMAPIHHRMPLIFEKNELKAWLPDDPFARRRIRRSSPLLEAPFL